MEPHTFKDVHIEIFLEIAGQLSMIVEKARLYEELHQVNDRLLEMATLDLQGRLKFMKSYLDLYLGGNLEKTTESQRAIMQKMYAAAETMLELITELQEDHPSS